VPSDTSIVSTYAIPVSIHGVEIQYLTQSRTGKDGWHAKQLHYHTRVPKYSSVPIKYQQIHSPV